MTRKPNVPSWRLKYVATINDDVLSEETDPDYEMQYVDIGNVDSSGVFNGTTSYSFSGAPSRARRRVRDGDVIVSCVRTYLQAIAPVRDPPDNLIVSTGFAVVRPRTGLLDGSFASYALREPSFLAGVGMRSAGVNYPAINASELREIPVYVPSEPRQRSISTYLDRETARIDALIAAKKRLHALTLEKRSALVTRAVTRGLDPNVPVRDSGVAWLGKVPVHWETKKLAWLFRERDQRGCPHLPLLEVSVNSGVALREFSKEHIESTADDFNTYKVARRRDVVFNKMRMWQGAVGASPTDGLVSPDYVVASPIGALTAHYAEFLFRTSAFSAECARRSHGIVWDRLRLYWEGFRNIEVCVPSSDEQATIVRHVRQESAKLEKLAVATRMSIKLLEERRSALIAAAVGGRINMDRTA